MSPAAAALLLLTTGPPSPQEDPLRGMIADHCVRCHESEEPAGDLDLEPLAHGDQEPERALLEALLRELASGRMPPRVARSRPTDEERGRALEWLVARLGGPPPQVLGSPTTLRRLNGREYRHALEDLFGLGPRAAGSLPGDGVSQGFDTIGETLSLPPALLEQYLQVAEELVDRVLPASQGGLVTLSGPSLLVDGEEPASPGVAAVLARRGEVVARLDPGRFGPAEVELVVGADQAGDEPAHLELRVNGRLLHEADVLGERDLPDQIPVRLELTGEPIELAVAFTNDYWDPDEPDPSRRDRNLHVHRIELDLQETRPAPTSFSRRWDIEGRPAAEVLADLAPLIWRGPVGPQEISELLRIDPEAVGEREQLRTALCALLVSPRFLFRGEAPAEEARPLVGRELATRLAAWLWCSVPDGAGLALGDEPVTDEELQAEVRRLLADPRSSRFTADFSRQWLQLERLEGREGGASLEPALLAAMRGESERFFEVVLREGLPLSTLLDADFTLVDGELAAHYGLPAREGGGFARVALAGRGRRGGVLGQAAVLTAASFPDRTSPVLRGKWVLEALLDEPPPPPPPDVAQRLEEEELAGVGIRERLERHRSDPSCASCHLVMDGLGFALEGYDELGRVRPPDGVDATGELPGGVRIEGAPGLASWLHETDGFRRGFVRRLTTYAVGRPLSPADEAALEVLLKSLGADPTIEEVILAIALSPLLRDRQPDGGAR